MKALLRTVLQGCLVYDPKLYSLQLKHVAISGEAGVTKRQLQFHWEAGRRRDGYSGIYMQQDTKGTWQWSKKEARTGWKAPEGEYRSKGAEGRIVSNI